MKIIVDRIEGEYAVCEFEDGTIHDILLSDLPSEVNEGCVLRFDGKKYINDCEAYQKRKAKILALQDSIFNE